jgi:uncharacterized RDD family membrane protein YckC
MTPVRETPVRERMALLLEGRRPNEREIVSPEGVPLTVELADYGERTVAVMLDLFLQSLAAMAIALVALVLAGSEGESVGRVVGLSVTLFIAFLIRNAYFLYFELAWQGSTPGKRVVGLRVIDRHGGPLLPLAVIARNLTREIELFLPLGILQSPLGQGASAWADLSLAAWLLLFALLPVFNRDRMRLGDLIAGTMVIALPRRMLLADLVETATHHGFSDRQLLAYGAYELQVLEELLRRPPGPDTLALRRDVCTKITRKIGWREPVPEADIDRFLADFYTAQRAYLEREQLFGRPRDDKEHAAKASS